MPLHRILDPSKGLQISSRVHRLRAISSRARAYKTAQDRHRDSDKGARIGSADRMDNSRDSGADRMDRAAHRTKDDHLAISAADLDRAVCRALVACKEVDHADLRCSSRRADR